MARIFITGSSDGLGLLAAKRLVKMGHRVVLHSRNEKRAKSTITAVPEAERVVGGDLSSIDETKNLAAEINELESFNTIIHNAGIYNAAYNEKSKDGLPLLFAVNSLAPYILTVLLNRPERLIYLSSNMHLGGDASEDKLTSILEGKYTPTYSDTKLHDLILALVVARKFPNVISNAVDPGWVPTKMGGKNAPDDLTEGYLTQVWLADGQDDGAKLSGRYLHHKKEANYHHQAKDIKIQEKFLSVCEQISGIGLE